MIAHCITCNEELIELPFDTETKRSMKECPVCNVVYAKFRGYGRHWYVGNPEEMY
jgi:uncharacterized protein with PIN domain